MTRALIGACTAAAMMMAVAQLSTATAQESECRGGMGTAAQTDRRSEAVQLARRINTAQSAARGPRKAYVPLEELIDITVPDGFAVQVVANTSSYIFTIKDKQDACGFGLFSDQNGLIYLAETLK